MRHIALLLALICSLAVTAAAPALAEEVTLETLLADPEAYEGEVTVTGELVGDYGFRNDGWVWSQLNADSYAVTPILEGGQLTGSNTGVGVRMPPQLVDGLGAPGGYRLRGPLVEVTGLWRYHDPDRGGESYLEVAELRVVDPARTLEEGPHWGNLTFGVVLLLAAGGLWLTRRRDA
jgi:MYXO-CTERM domain-containing protein